MGNPSLTAYFQGKPQLDWLHTSEPRSIPDPDLHLDTQPGGGIPPENFGTLHSNFNIYRNFQRMKMKFYILIMFKKNLI